MMSRFKCNECPSSYTALSSLKQHKRRKHGVRARPAPTSRSSNTGVKEQIRQALAGHPDGLPVKDIIAAMKKNGYRSKGTTASILSHIGSTASHDPNIVRAGRGVYRLNAKMLAEFQPHEPSAAPVAVAEREPEPEIELSIQALLVRIEHLEKDCNALRAAHTTYVREMA